MPQLEPSEFFDQITAYLGKTVSSFNQKIFPNKTLDLIKEYYEFVEKNTRILSLSPVEQQLKDSLIDLVDELKKFRNEALSDSNDISKTVKSKNFVEAKIIFKKSLEFFLPSLKPTEKGLQSPSTVWPKTFKILQKILG